MVIAHRGSSGHFPEHSLGGYTDAYYGGTDFIELDLQVTKDGQLVAQHDSYLNDSTDVLQYESLFGDKVHHDGKYYVEDFTLQELKLLKRKQRYTFRSTLLNDKFEILTLQEVINNVNLLVTDAPRTENTGTTVGLYIELKDFNSYLSKGIDMAELMNDILVANSLGTISDCQDTMPIIVQSFDFEALERYAELSDLPLIQLAHWGDEYLYDWDKISQVAHGCGPDSRLVFNTDYKAEDFAKNSVPNAYSEFIT